MEVNGSQNGLTDQPTRFPDTRLFPDARQKKKAVFGLIWFDLP